MRPVIIANSLRRQRGFSWFRVFGNTEGIGPRDAMREEGERGARGRFAQHRIMGRHVIGRRPSRLVGTDELLREKEPRGGVRGAGQEAWIAGGRKGGRLGRNGWTLERGLVTRVEYESSGGREEEGGGGERAPRVLRY